MDPAAVSPQQLQTRRLPGTPLGRLWLLPSCMKFLNSTRHQHRALADFQIAI